MILFLSSPATAAMRKAKSAGTDANGLVGGLDTAQPLSRLAIHGRLIKAFQSLCQIANE
jgi:hypothetical protein